MLCLIPMAAFVCAGRTKVFVLREEAGSGWARVRLTAALCEWVWAWAESSYWQAWDSMAGSRQQTKICHASMIVSFAVCSLLLSVTVIDYSCMCLVGQSACVSPAVL
eukprot:GDKI01044574.1.p1 GENE.GDKI01044574.1~~GDKI01044574.1.p1  ORF type:complete len:107 (+),score=6.90 GDKI01044574.1:48-368(+)